MSKRDYYEVLEISRDSNDDQIKKAFRSLARKHHPDKNQGDSESEARFKEIQEAYAVLSNPEQRQRYDMFGHEQPGGGPFGPSGFQGVNVSFDDLFNGGFESIFSQFFTGQRTRQSNRGRDVLIHHSIPFELVMTGGEGELSADLLDSCEECGGNGARNEDGISTCDPCRGAGRVTQNRKVGPFLQQVVTDCANCDGIGKVVTDPCTACNGKGSERRNRVIRFTVPAGISDGTRLRMAQKGEPPKGGLGRQGDLYIQIDVEDHAWFERDASDLLMALPLGYTELLMGATISLPHIDGEELEITVPAGSKPGETLEISSRGLPHPRYRRRGSVTVLLKLHVPKKVSKQTRQILTDIQSDIGVSQDDVESLVRSEAKSRRRG